MKRALTILRAMTIEGRHLQHCFIDPKIQEQGRRLQQQARRAARRLGWKPEAVL